MLAWNCVSGRSNVKSTWSRSRTPDLSQKRCLRGQVVTDRGRGATAFAHGVADLIQAQHDIASSIKTRNIGPLMRHRKAAILGAVCPDCTPVRYLLPCPVNPHGSGTIFPSYTFLISLTHP